MSSRHECGTQNNVASSESTPSNGGMGGLPAEIVSYIFVIGCNEEDEEPDDDSDETSTSESSRSVHFATLCSHVCQYWRNVAIGTPELWSRLDFYESYPFQKSQVWITRSKAVPLTIEIDHTDEEDTVANTDEQDEQRQAIILKEEDDAIAIASLILPVAYRWRSLEVTADAYQLIQLWQKQLVYCGPTPILEHFGMLCHEGIVDLDIFHPQHLHAPISIFASGVPKLRSVILWGVHIDWEAATFLAGLDELRLAFHTKDTRLSLDQFVRVLNRSPELKLLCLDGSAPLPGDWPLERIALNELNELIIANIDLEEAMTIVEHIAFPALRNLTLDLEDESVKPFIDVVCGGFRKRRFQTVEFLKLTSFACRPRESKKFLLSMPNITSMTLNFHWLPLHFRDALMGAGPLLCPRLDTLKLSGLEDKALTELIVARQKGPTPILRLYLDQDDGLSDITIWWLKAHIETVQFYEVSDEETESGEDRGEETESDEDGDEETESDEDGDEDEDEGDVF